METERRSQVAKQKKTNNGGSNTARKLRAA